MGAGTHLGLHDADYDDGSITGWPLAPPAKGVCSVGTGAGDTRVEPARGGGRRLFKGLDLARRGRQAAAALSSDPCACRTCPAGMTSAGGDPGKAACLPLDVVATPADGHAGVSPSPAPRRVLFPIPTPPPGPSTAIKAPYKGFYKDLASISNYVGTSLDDHSTP